MRRILFQWRGITIWSYPAMIYLGCVAGVIAGNIAAHAAGVDALRVYVATLMLIPAGLIGARLLYVITNLRLYRENPRRIWNRSEGGAAQYGALLFVLPLSVPLLARLKLPFGVFWDVAVFMLLVLMIFGRIGCLLNGCCAGRPSRSWFSLYLPNHDGVHDWRIPTQCLEAGTGVVLLLGAIVIWPRLPFAGALFLIVAVSYGSGRLLLESTRDRAPGAARFTIHHGISLLMVVFSLLTLTALWSK